MKWRLRNNYKSRLVQRRKKQRRIVFTKAIARPIQSFTTVEQIVEWIQPEATSQFDQLFDADEQIIDWVQPRAYQQQRRAFTLITSQPYGIFIYNAFWPYQLTKDITHSAWNLNRSYKRMDIGQATINVSRKVASDPRLYPGSLLVVISKDQPAWVGPIYVITDNLRDGHTNLQAADMGSILAKRVIPQEERYSTLIGTSQIIRSYITRMNGRGPTGISLARDLEAGPLIQDVTSGGQTVLDGANELFTRTDWEWWLEYKVTAGRIRTIFHWGRRQGLDLRRSAHFYHGINIKDATYKEDLSEGKQVSTFLGGFGVPIWDRPSVSQSAISGINRPLANNTRFAPESIVRAFQDLPAALRDERVNLSVTSNSSPDLIKQTYMEQRRAIDKEHLLSVTFNNINDRSPLMVGNTISIHVPLGRHGNFDGAVRITDVQPDEELGEIDCEAEILI